jgi:hypothetical protein
MPRMSPGGTDASLLELIVGFVVAVALITAITLILRRRRDARQDLLGGQMREMQARTAAAASPDANTRSRDAAIGTADARRHEAAAPAPAFPAPTSSSPASPISTSPDPSSPASTSPAPAPSSPASPSPDFAPAPAADAAPPGSEFPDVLAGESRPAPDATTPPDGWPLSPGATNDAMADAFAWLRIAALVEAGQRDQAIELLSTTMAISAEEAGMLVDGLTDAG